MVRTKKIKAASHVVAAVGSDAADASVVPMTIPAEGLVWRLVIPKPVMAVVVDLLIPPLPPPHQDVVALCRLAASCRSLYGLVQHHPVVTVQRMSHSLSFSIYMAPPSPPLGSWSTFHTLFSHVDP